MRLLRMRVTTTAWSRDVQENPLRRGFTLLSRLSGFVRDIVLAAVLGAGAMMDAFSVWRCGLPKISGRSSAKARSTRPISPAYARVSGKQGGEAAAALFSNRVFSLNLIVQLVLVAIALPFMPDIVRLLAPGFANDPLRFDLAVALTRITFPYLLFITLVTLLSANLNAVDRYAAGRGGRADPDESLPCRGARRRLPVSQRPPTRRPGAWRRPGCSNGCCSPLPHGARASPPPR